MNEVKSVLTPQQKIGVCGFCFDFVANRIALTKETRPSFAQLGGVNIANTIDREIVLGSQNFSIKLIQFALFPYLGAE